jgi:hypothetical protein
MTVVPVKGRRATLSGCAWDCRAQTKMMKERRNKKAASHLAALERSWGSGVTQAALGKAEYEMTDTSVCSERNCLSRAVTLSVTSPVM